MSASKIFGNIKMKELLADSIIGILRLRNSQRHEFGLEKIRKTSLQKRVLQEVYKLTDFPSTNTREELALLLGLPHRSIQVWFQNKRQKNRQTSSISEKDSLINKENVHKVEQNTEYGSIATLDTYEISTCKLIEIIEFCQEEEKKKSYMFLTFK
ncbi:Homeodomain-like protein [Trachipleistophora hominis]|uniref:Homeodomain-like protein n=1 Tax=Trachipleistophora hominis TaxID=72359 RepID=L7JW69_TRAHO|nr:Homeodomain-like protein [Trachipleistophora hominis]